MRVFEAKLRHGRTQQDQQWATPAQSALSWFHAAATSTLGRVAEIPITLAAVEQAAQLPTIGPMKRGHRYVRFDSVEQHGNRLSLTVMYGMVSDFEAVMNASGNDELIGNRPTVRGYRVELLTPPKDGSGLLAVETIGRVCPETAVTAWLGFASHVARPDDATPWPRLVTDQATDPDYLAKLVQQAQEVEVRLKHSGPDAVGNRNRTQYHLRGPVHVNQRGKAIDWAKAKKREVSGMLAILGINNDGDFDFNDGYMSVDDGETTTRIGLLESKEKFTYPVSPERLDDDKWRDQVKKRFATLRPSLKWV